MLNFFSSYENWDVFEPNDHLGEDCVEMDTLERDGRWNDQSCDRKIDANSYICGMQSTRKSKFLRVLLLSIDVEILRLKGRVHKL